MSLGKKAVVAVALIGGAVILYDFGAAIIWDGEYLLTVRLQPAEPNKVGRVWVAPVSSWDTARENLHDHDWADRTLKEVADVREPFVVSVMCSWKTAGFGRQCWYSQYRALVLRVEYTDGRREFTLVDIPDGKQTQEVTVQLP